LEELGRPRIDVVMTLSGIFRDLLPLQTRMLAEAAWKAATADEPVEMNFVRAHALDYAEKMGVDMEEAALRVFSNAEGAYGSNVNALVDSGAGARRTSWPMPTRRARASPMAWTARPRRMPVCFRPR
jgi:magnesium chelatase subunit H